VDAVLRAEGEPKQDLAQRMTRAFAESSLDFSARPEVPPIGWLALPEIEVAERLRGNGADNVAVRLFVTFVAALDRARDATALWRAAEQLWIEAPWAFDPEGAIRAGSKLAASLKEHRVSQRHTHDSDGWRQIAFSLAGSRTAPLVHRAIYEGEGDAIELLSSVQDERDGRSLFPFLRGPKISPMWVRMLAFPGNAHISSIDRVPAAVDVHVLRVTEYLGVASTLGSDAGRIRRRVQEGWFEQVRASGAAGPPGLENSSAILDPVLWVWGKWGCAFCELAGERRPIGDACAGCRFDGTRRAGQLC